MIRLDEVDLADCLSEVVKSRIESSVLRKQYSLGVFFDLEGVFDNGLTSKGLEGLVTIARHIATDARLA